MNVNFSATHIFPPGGDKRMVSQWGNFFTKEDPNKRAVKAIVTARYSTSEEYAQVDIKGWCQRIKKDGTDSTHAPSDVWDASQWLTEAEYLLMADKIVAEARKNLVKTEIIEAIVTALADKIIKCTYGQEEA